MIQNILSEMISYYGRDVRRTNHALKVYSFCNTIGSLEQLGQKELLTVILSGILHDIGILEAERKYNSSAGPYQEKEGPPIARQIMERNNVDAGIVERVCFIVGNHHSYSNIDGIDFQILVEADFLVNIYEDDMGSSAVETIREKYFKTASGTGILDRMYL